MQSSKSRLLALALFIFIFTLGGLLRFTSIQYPYSNPDEIFSIKVTQHILTNKTLDTNFQNAGVPGYQDNPQYNFSGYHIISAGILGAVKGTVWGSKLPNYQILRYWSALLGTISILLTLILGKYLFNLETGLLGSFFVAINPLLFQNSIYARAETLVDCLTLCYLIVLFSTNSKYYLRIFGSSTILGILIATKFSMLILAPLLVLLTNLSSNNTDKPKCLSSHYKKGFISARAFALACFGTFIGFLCFAPYAVIHPDQYIAGLKSLYDQYSNGFWPHGLTNSGVIGRLIYSLNYFFPTQGWFIFAMSLCGLLIAAQEKKYRQVITFIVFFIFALRFATYNNFFERNFSNLLPIFLLFAAYALYTLFHLTSRLSFPARVLLLLSGIWLAAYPSCNTSYHLLVDELQEAKLIAIKQLRTRVENEFGLKASDIGLLKSRKDIIDKYSQICGPILIEISYGKHRDLEINLAALKNIDGYIEVGRVNSPFQYVSFSTLNTYFPSTTIFLYKNISGSHCKK